MFEIHDGFRNSLVGVGLAAALMAGVGCDRSNESDEGESASPERQVDTSTESETNEKESSDESGGSATASNEPPPVAEGPIDDRELETFLKAYRVYNMKTDKIDEACRQADSEEEARRIAEKRLAEVDKAVERAGMAPEKFHGIRRRVKEGNEKLRSRISEMAPEVELPDKKMQPEAGRP